MQKTFQNVVRNGFGWLECSTLSAHPWLLHAFTTRRREGAARGELDLSRPSSDAPSRVHGHWRKALNAMKAEAFSLALMRQIHSDHIWSVTRDGESRGLRYVPRARAGGATDVAREPRGDALITQEPGVLLAVLSADCLPILVADSRRRAVAAIHAGWRGALAGIVEKAVHEMAAAFGSRPEDLVVAMGPSIRSCCYEVESEVVAAFQRRFPRAEEFFTRNERPARAGRATLDLVAVARRQLVSAGVRRSKIHVADFCTACRTDLFFSYRKEGQAAGRMAALMGIVP
jgi:purine-nucleoside/S-methyl-5'-thioadenosine phosphorylase / adenosine deaminase